MTADKLEQLKGLVERLVQGLKRIAELVEPTTFAPRSDGPTWAQRTLTEAATALPELLAEIERLRRALDAANLALKLALEDFT